jgi:hypothetical protein
MLLKLFEQKNFLSNCSKQLVTPVNLTRIFFHELLNFQDWERAPKAKKLPFLEVISAIVQGADYPHLLLLGPPQCFSPSGTTVDGLDSIR